MQIKLAWFEVKIHLCVSAQGNEFEFMSLFLTDRCNVRALPHGSSSGKQRLTKPESRAAHTEC